MKTKPPITFLLAACLLLPLSAAAQPTTVRKARSAPGPDPDLFDGSAAEAEDRPESGIISDFEMGSGESAQQSSQSRNKEQEQQQEGQQQGGGAGQGSENGEQQEGSGGGASEMIEEGQQEAQEFGQQGEQGAQQGGQQGGQQGSQQSSSSSRQSSQQAPTEEVKLGDESLKIETVDLPADEEMIGQKENKKAEAKDVSGSGASGKQGPRRNTGVERGDAMPSEI